jgi:hypothetical protein
MNCPENCGCKGKIERNEKDIQSINNRMWMVGLMTIGQLLVALGGLIMFLLGVFK